MRLQLSRRVTTAAVCAALVLGTAAPVAAARELPRDSGADTTPSPAPGPMASEASAASAAPAQQTKPVEDVGDVLKPVADLVRAALKAPGGELSAADIEKHTKAIRDAVTALKATVPADALADVVATVEKSTDSVLEPAAAADPQQP
ncbi:hypothetical protein OIE62_17880 [Streptomyces scopuliridis]|uniref:Uncharacterized protein n=1 Tax=Streptomyces scopuliridis TaxID=452529 RepID=A0ACD4ZN47_9ACTN|nr:hypothetical protein [Streptomyces scopuliridis]WSB35355.1 hypothetical protein OG949_22555 [Streptomyces scopuliridis]WSB99600.1 hypothetical protein OG835_23080 [Streptomyces scopuliridis]WSC06702.1 hypothetical protein OIE62_17880 [Streptomyces scopuliridis]